MSMSVFLFDGSISTVQFYPCLLLIVSVFIRKVEKESSKKIIKRSQNQIFFTIPIT